MKKVLIPTVLDVMMLQCTQIEALHQQSGSSLIYQVCIAVAERRRGNFMTQMSSADLKHTLPEM